MNKAELIEAMAKAADCTKTQAGSALDGFCSAVTTALKKGDKVTLVGFGTFSVSKRAARIGRNPQTGKEIKIAAKKVAKTIPRKAPKPVAPPVAVNAPRSDALINISGLKSGQKIRVSVKINIK